jgi:cytochrome c556
VTALPALLLACACAPAAPDRSAEIAQLKAEVERLREIAGPLPSSLDRLYPPAAKEPVFLLAMHAQAEPLFGVVLKATQGDMAGAKKYFGQFREAYGRASSLVPEWKDKFPAAPVDAVGTALEGGAPDKVMAALQALGESVCARCHMVNMPKVMQVKHWSDFSVLSLTDPATRKPVPFAAFMFGLEMSFAGIGIELKEGHVDKAREYFAAFNGAMGELRTACAACHDSERKYYVDASAQSTIDALGAALKSPAPDAAAVGGLMDRIGMDTCHKCHLVHMPAAMTQMRFKEMASAGAGPAAGAAPAAQ